MTSSVVTMPVSVSCPLGGRSGSTPHADGGNQEDNGDDATEHRGPRWALFRMMRVRGLGGNASFARRHRPDHRATIGVYLRFSGLRPSSSFEDEAAVFADEHVVEIQFAAAHRRVLAEDQVPVDGAVVAVGGFFVALAGREVDGAGDFFVEEDVLHGLGAIGVEADGEFADVAGAFIGVEDLVEGCGVGGRGLDDLAVPEDEADVGVGQGAIDGRAVVMDDAVDGVADGGGVYFAVGDIALAVALLGGDAFDGERQVGVVGAFDADAVGALHETP